MRAGRSRELFFILPFRQMVSNYVRAECLDGYAINKWRFTFVKGSYPIFFNYFLFRTLYRYWFYLKIFFKIKLQSIDAVAYFIKPQSPLLLFIVRRFFRIKVMVDVNDPYHLPSLMGKKITEALFKNADWLIFESKEYFDYWAFRYQHKSSIVSDTPQHECIYINSLNRGESVIWVGSPNTSPYLIDFIEHFKLFNEYGYKVKLLGASEEIVNVLRNASINFFVIKSYNTNILAAELEQAFLSFVPMPSEELFELRGNLKAKLSMGFGCLVIASRNDMHERLISDGENGFLFNTVNELRIILERIKNKSEASNMAVKGNIYVANKYSRYEHAMKLIKIANELSG
jgi:glycosyltransferase involved in cell wall biosynthesis